MTAWPFGDLPLMHYRCILADPPWRFVAGGDRGAREHYDVLTVEQIAALPVGNLCAGDCALFLWVTNPLLPRAFEVMAAWGFEFKTVAFTWAKTRRKHDTAEIGPKDWHMGLGFWTRSNTEMCLLATRGRPQILTHDVRQLVVAPLREHSRKPAQVHEGIERLVAGPRLELFGREKRADWAVWGLETDKFSDADRAAAPASV